MFKIVKTGEYKTSGKETVLASGEACVYASGEATVYATGETKVYAHGGTVYAWDKATVESNGTWVEAWDQSYVRAHGGYVKANNQVACAVSGKCNVEAFDHSYVRTDGDCYGDISANQRAVVYVDGNEVRVHGEQRSIILTFGGWVEAHHQCVVLMDGDGIDAECRDRITVHDPEVKMVNATLVGDCQFDLVSVSRAKGANEWLRSREFPAEEVWNCQKAY